MLKKLKAAYWNKNIRHWVGILGLMAISVFSVNLHHELGVNLASIMNLPEHAAFDGTVMPIQHVPDWRSLSPEEFDYSYDDLAADKFLSSPPAYDNADFIFPSGDLIWGNAAHDEIANAKITYPVPYAGSYDLGDKGEGAGSHPAVDIKVLKDTPVHNIANGVVYDEAYSSSWGYYVVVKHADVPNPKSVGQTTDLYCSYSHLSQPAFVNEGDEIDKGMVIGKAGDTGTATTHHLHFQCDADSASWHPYWPFTTAEASAQGYGFWDAVSAGVGKFNLYAHTYNPMAFVNEHSDGSVPVIVVEDEVEEEVVEEIIEEIVEEEEVVEVLEEPEVEEVAIEEEIASSVIHVDFSSVDLEQPDFIMVGDNRQLIVKLRDPNGDLIENPTFDGDIEVTVTDDDLASVNRTTLNTADFDSDGEAELMLYANRAGTVQLEFKIADLTFPSGDVYLLDAIEPFAHFGIDTDGSFIPNKAENINVLALDLEREPTPDFDRNGTVELSLVKGSGSFSPSTLDKTDFYSGTADVTFTADTEEDVIIKVTFGMKEYESSVMRAYLFTDLAYNDDYYDAISYLSGMGAIQGYADGTFGSYRNVNRVESLKFAFAGLKRPLLSLNPSFPDTYENLWYSQYVATAEAEEIVAGYPSGFFHPENPVNRVEFAKIILNMIDASIDPVVLGNPYDDVDNLSWFAPYVQHMKEYNLFPADGDNFYPSQALTRGEVAETIYRIIVSEQNGGVPYSVHLDVE
ncbi:peptidoglycan DD-metalloendopeptidase family protein [Candidatus Peregrinibacteria bacterium]|jgi:hypothetical protein|nr:peptidoglycan DD-metalloendopeptidase family protein [Candidatus Peregrinibacteria bacterium]MBT4631935.1 peptidoglycan DD-metalloendopeptidase family protein [Candidatus Peregrinibacteria bacterium]MBT5516453.1 peptidoglycan DD-metalloendopeptidase family protein [Candidatus Peregrinibacteria bacterium]MBT5823678.1 peptidoglycan DD-metalloendopeptidase family protein [Candidatus Peregrinibacteria bacterium]